MSCNLSIRFLFFTLHFLFYLPTFAQKQKDTVINGYKIRYNFFDVYANPTDLDNAHPLLSIGTIKNDSVKTGTWYFFYPSGKLLAKGKYIDGYKKGTWTYYPRKKDRVKVKWSKKHQLKSEIVFDNNNDPVIRETTGTGIQYFNGHLRNSRVRFL